MIKKNLINLLSHAKKYVVYNVLCQWIALLAQIAAIFTISGLLEKNIFGNVSLKGELWTEIGKSAIILLAVIVIRYLCDRLAAKSSYAASVDVKRILREKIYNKLLKLGVSYRDKVSTSEVVQLNGASGSGKSTMLKLLMHFWDVQQGSVNINKENIKKLPTTTLRKLEGYMTQETHLFHDSIANNIAIGKVGASREEIMEAAKKASIHEFIMTLPDGYDTQVGELGETLSGGERQRIGIARAFLHDAQLLLLDEPTSNLDSLNEGIILKSMKESAEEKTVVLVSHRESTMQVADVIFKMNHGRLS